MQRKEEERNRNCSWQNHLPGNQSIHVGYLVPAYKKSGQVVETLGGSLGKSYGSCRLGSKSLSCLFKNAARNFFVSALGPLKGPTQITYALQVKKLKQNKTKDFLSPVPRRDLFMSQW